MIIEYGTADDFAVLKVWDKHLSPEQLQKALVDKRIIILKEGNKLCGWLRYNFFWDNTPFLNMLEVLEEYRNKKHATELMAFWEKEMQNQGFRLLLTSSQSDEKAQHFYRKLGYCDAGVLLLDTQASEIFFRKELRK